MFDLGKAVWPLLFNPAKFSLLWELLDDKDALDAHFKRWTFTSYDDTTNELIEKSVSETDKGTVSGTYKQYVQAIAEARSHYSDMLLVAAYTHLEDIVCTFFYELFLAKPQLLIRYIKDLKEPLTISLPDFIVEEKQDLLAKLAKKNATKACNGEIERVCGRINKMAGCEIPKVLQGEISELQQKRNRVVHEAAVLDSSLDDVNKYYTAVNDFLIILARAAESHGVHVYDPAYMITERPQVNDSIANV